MCWSSFYVPFLLSPHPAFSYVVLRDLSSEQPPVLLLRRLSMLVYFRYPICSIASKLSFSYCFSYCWDALAGFFSTVYFPSVLPSSSYLVLLLLLCPLPSLPSFCLQLCFLREPAPWATTSSIVKVGLPFVLSFFLDALASFGIPCFPHILCSTLHDHFDCPLENGDKLMVQVIRVWCWSPFGTSI